MKDDEGRWLNLVRTRRRCRCDTPRACTKYAAAIMPDIRVIVRPHLPCGHDATHSPMFLRSSLGWARTELQGLEVEYLDFIQAFFEPPTSAAFSPRYFPFTEPSAEIDIMFERARHRRWLEVPVRASTSASHSEHGSGPRAIHRFCLWFGIDRLAMCATA